MKVLKNILKTVVGNLSSLVSGVLVGFLLPKIISVADYGLYKTFTLYFNYLGVLSLGIIDGIVLRYGEKDFGDLDRRRFRSFFAWYAILHFALTFVAVAVSFFVANGDYKFILLILALNLLPSNGIGYFQQVSQITERFGEYSARKILQAVANILLVLAMYLLYKNGTPVGYRQYLIGLSAIHVLLLAWYLVTYRDIVFGEKIPLGESFRDLLGLMKIGFPLLLANMCSTLLLSLDRQFVNVLFTNEEYAVYAFAYSILSLITVATSAISLVIYPVFKRTDGEKLKKLFPDINALLLIFLFGTVTVYFPLVWFIGWFLPQYEYSLTIFRIILPGLAVSCSITVVMHNYYKVFGKSTGFFRKSLVALAVSFACNVIAYAIWGTRESISIASIFSVSLWYLHTQWGLRKDCGFDGRGALYALLMGAIFYLCSANFVPETWQGLLLYLALFVLVTGLFFFPKRRAISGLLRGGNNAKIENNETVVNDSGTGENAK